MTQLLVRDLPNVLWWMGKPLLDLSEVEAMAEIADLLIFDSAECDPELEGLRALSSGARKWRGEKVIADLNWNRLADWRELIAQFFDCAVTRPLVHNIERVTIEVCRETRDECTSIQGLLLAGWLSSRLGWEEIDAEDGQEIRIGLRRAGGKVDLRIAP